MKKILSELAEVLMQILNYNSRKRLKIHKIIILGFNSENFLNNLESLIMY